MSNRTTRWMLCLGLVVMGMLLAGETISATGAAQPRDAASLTFNRPSSPASDAKASRTAAAVGMGDLMSQTFEFVGAFPSGWQVYDAISPTVGNYLWSTTTITSAEDTHSAAAALGGVSGATLTPTADYAAAVDSWMVYGPVSLARVWQAQLDFAYYFTPTASGTFTVGVSTDYDPISRTGTFSEMMSAPTAGWRTNFTRDLSSYAGQKVYVAFRYQTPDGGNVADGPFVDDVHVRANYRALLPLVSKWMLNLSKSASSNVAWTGQSLVYSLTVYNNDISVASGVLLTDTVPTGTVFVSADGGGTFNAASRVVSWSGLTVLAQSSVVRHLTVAVPGDAPAGFKVVNKDYAISVPPNPMTMFGLPVTTPVAFNYLDDFSNPASGWPIGSWTGGIECSPPGSWRAGYMTGGTYGVNTGCAWNGMVYPSPVRIADTANFTLEVDLRSNQGDLWYSSYGVFFNASEDLRQMYIVRIFQGQEPPEFAIYRWPNFQGSSDDQPPPVMWLYSTCNECDGADYAWNHIAVRRRGALFEVYMGKSGGALARQATIVDDAYMDSNHARVGVHHGNFEWRGDAGAAFYAYVFDNFRLSPATR